MPALLSGSDAAALHQALDHELREQQRLLLWLAQQLMCDGHNRTLKKDLWACHGTIAWIEYCLGHYQEGQGFFPGAGSLYAEGGK